MPHGTLEVVLISAKGLEDNDFLSSIDPYVILTYKEQEYNSTVQEGAGSNPQWNETFLFTVSDTDSELILKIMEKDNSNNDDNIGEAVITLDGLFEEGSLPEAAYKLVKDEEYCGEIWVALTFTASERNDEESYNEEEDTIGGWKESASDF